MAVRSLPIVTEAAAGPATAPVAKASAQTITAAGR
jgi:hypothetical protein